MSTRATLLLLVTACSFQGYGNTAKSDANPGSGDATSPDAAPIMCGDLSCDPNAICHDSGTGPATCSCPTGYHDDNGNGTACSDIDECANPTTCTDVGQTSCQNTPGSYVSYTATSCADTHAHGVANGATTLYAGGDKSKPWQAWCDDDKTYLPLPQGQGKNYAQFTHVSGPGGGGQTDVRTTYMMVRFDPATFRVDIRDKAHAQSTGRAYVGLTQIDSMGYACAADCNGNNQASGSANVDLTGTNFRVADVQTWELDGQAKKVGAATASSDNQIWAITGGGQCGWAIPAPGIGNTNPPINNFSGNSGILLLEYKN